MKVTRYDSSIASRSTIARVELAIQQATVSDMRQKHGAVLFIGGRLVATGINVQRNVATNYIPYPNISTHAEINCIRGLGAVTGKLYIARIAPSGSVLNSAPCPRCYDYLTRYTRITHIIHT